MKKLILILICALYSTISYSQYFIGNKDYVYSIGFGSTIEEADKDALSMLSSMLKTHVKTYSIHQVTQINNKIDEKYSQNTITNSSIELKDCHIYTDSIVSGRTKVYKVYRYINKKEYVDNRLKVVKSLIENKKSIIYIGNKKIYNSINLRIGNYYYAYQILDDDLMTLFYYKNEDLKDFIKNKAIELQKMIFIKETSGLYFNVLKKDIPIYGKDMDHINRSFFDDKNIYFLDMTPDSYNLDIEYWNGKNWVDTYDKSFTETYSKLYRIPCNDLLHRNKYTLNNHICYKTANGTDRIALYRQLKYRIKFETLTDTGEIIAINVPDDWYIIKEMFMAPKDEVISWIRDDIERGYISANKAKKIVRYLYEEY